MSPRRSDPLSPTDLGAIADAALDNADSLIRSANELLSSDRFPVANSLALLAAEEYGKHMMCFSAVGKDPTDAAYWRRFWNALQDHHLKYKNAFIMAAVGLLLDQTARTAVMNALDQHVTADKRNRESGLYVDFDASTGTVLSPVDVIQPQHAETTVGTWTYVIGIAKELWSRPETRAVFAPPDE